MHLGSDGLFSKTTFIYLHIKRSLSIDCPNSLLIIVDKADLAVFNALYPTPVLNIMIRNSITSFIGGEEMSILCISQYSNRKREKSLIGSLDFRIDQSNLAILLGSSSIFTFRKE